MRELSLFTGAGGGLLGTKLLGWEHVGYVEKEPYCQKVIKARIDDGLLDAAPIFGDINAFIREGYAEAYQGMVDVVTAGFPCQPFSLAGKRLAENDPRNGWPATIDCLRIIRPRFALLENVPGLLSSGYFGRILGDLAESGYDCRWRVLSAAELGASHKRDRLWIVANNRGQRIQRGREEAIQRESVFSRGKNGGGIEKIRKVSNVFTSKLCRKRNEVANQLDRLKALGNGQVPPVVAAAWELLKPFDAAVGKVKEGKDQSNG